MPKIRTNKVHAEMISPQSDCLCRYDDQLLQLTVSCLYLSAMVGALGSELSRPLGRKVMPCLHMPCAHARTHPTFLPGCQMAEWLASMLVC